MPPRKTPHFVRERRAGIRFPVFRELTYKAPGVSYGSFRTGQGTSLEIGSGGVSFTADDRMNTGERIELSISWPALLDGRLALRLRVIGIVLRSDSQSAVCSIEKYEFRIGGATRGKAIAPADCALPAPADRMAFAAQA
jgi:hypothetical protein